MNSSARGASVPGTTTPSLGSLACTSSRGRDVLCNLAAMVRTAKRFSEAVEVRITRRKQIGFLDR